MLAWLLIRKCSWNSFAKPPSVGHANRFATPGLSPVLSEIFQLEYLILSEPSEGNSLDTGNYSTIQTVLMLRSFSKELIENIKLNPRCVHIYPVCNVPVYKGGCFCIELKYTIEVSPEDAHTSLCHCNDWKIGLLRPQVNI